MIGIKWRPKIDKLHLSRTAAFLANHPVIRQEFGDLKNSCEDRALAGYVGFWMAGYEPRIHCIEMGPNADGRKGEIVPLGADGEPLYRRDAETGEMVKVAWQRHFIVRLGDMFWDPAISQQPIPMRHLRRHYKIPRRVLHIGDSTRTFMRDLAHSAEGHFKKLFPQGPEADASFRPLQKKAALVVPYVFE